MHNAASHPFPFAASTRSEDSGNLRWAHGLAVLRLSINVKINFCLISFSACPLQQSIHPTSINSFLFQNALTCWPYLRAGRSQRTRPVYLLTWILHRKPFPLGLGFFPHITHSLDT